MQDRDTINQENTINYRIRLEEREIKNKILAMSDTKKKQVEWNKHFPPLQATNDDWLLSAKVF